MIPVTKKEVLLLTLSPIFVLSILDLITTYYGVCVYGGIELNVSAIASIQKFGFLLGGVIHMGIMSLTGLFFSFLLWISRKHIMLIVFTMIITVGFITNLVDVVVINANEILYMATGISIIPPHGHMEDVTESQIEQIEESFNREEFCRLI